MIFVGEIIGLKYDFEGFTVNYEITHENLDELLEKEGLKIVPIENKTQIF